MFRYLRTFKFQPISSQGFFQVLTASDPMLLPIQEAHYGSYGSDIILIWIYDLWSIWLKIDIRIKTTTKSSEPSVWSKQGSFLQGPRISVHDSGWTKWCCCSRASSNSSAPPLSRWQSCKVQMASSWKRPSRRQRGNVEGWNAMQRCI